MIINKYKLYLVVLGVVVLVMTAKNILYLIFFDRAEGQVSGSYNQWVQRKMGQVNVKYPRIIFQVDSQTIEFASPSYMFEVTGHGKKVTVVYNKKNPQDAYVINFYGLFGNAAIFLIPFFLIWTICIFHPDLIPKRIVVY